jgi:cytochrome P450
MLQYGPDWRKQRAAFFDMLNPRSVAKYDTVMQEQSARLLADVVRSPPAPTKTASRTLNEQIASYTGNLVMTLTYGSKLATPENLSAVMPIMKGVLFDAAPGAHLVDTFPILDRLPDWLSSWRAEANAKHAYESKLYLRLVRSVREDMLAGNAEECFATRLWDDHDEGKFDELTLAYVAGSAFEASIRTTAGTLMWMIMALVMNPHVQKKAHQEIDNVLLATHDTTLEPPTLDLLTKLPYCVAIIKEAMRWMPVAPGAFPHAATNDDTYKGKLCFGLMLNSLPLTHHVIGYFIPKGTLVFPNIFAMHRDPRNYVEPDSFDPERFMSVTTDMGSNEIFVEGHWAFGFGRRICPARYLAGKLLFTAAVRLLWAFDFKPVFDENGKPMAIDRFDCPWEVLK